MQGKYANKTVSQITGRINHNYTKCEFTLLRKLIGLENGSITKCARQTLIVIFSSVERFF